MAKNTAISVDSRKREQTEDPTHLLLSNALDEDAHAGNELSRPTAKRFRKPTNGAHETAGKLQCGLYDDAEGTIRHRSFGFNEYIHQGRIKSEWNEQAHMSPNQEKGGTLVSSIESCAAVLASIDRRASARAFFSDADVLLERIVLPMSFPWSQSNEGLAFAIDRDIDELVGITLAGEEASNTMWERRRRLGGKVSARRSEDPGVIEYRVLSKPSMMRTRFSPPFHSPSFKKENPALFGELSLRSFLETGARSQIENQSNSDLGKTKLISFNLASTSSRSTLFDSFPETGRHPLLLLALLPVEIHSGIRTTKLLADEIAQKLGSYDCRHGKPKEDEDSYRFRAGRTRKIWTRKVPGSSTRASILTGEQLLPGTWKRPRMVKVGIRINGVLLSAALEGNLSSEDQVVYRQGLIDSAIGAAYSYSGIQAPASGARSQCRLEIESFLKSSLQKSRTTKEAQVPKIFAFKPTNSTNIKQSIILSFRSPRIECFPAEDGLLHTVCAQVGTMTIAPPKTMARILDLTSSERRMCTICWSRSNEHVESDGSSLLRCKGCDLVVHRQCYGVSCPGPHWMCDTCDRLVADHTQPVADKTYLKKIRWGVRCVHCPTTGSSLVCHEEGGMVHNVCRDWGQKNNHTRPCALCGTYSKVLVRCAAKNCHVEFHPLCALIASNAADLLQRQTKEETSSDVASRDEFLCTQFRLVRLEVGSRASDRLETVCAAFCGLHNPDRQDDFYGLPAGGDGLATGMRIPPLRLR